METLFTDCKTLALEIKTSGGLLAAWDNESSELFAKYEKLVNLVDNDFYTICELNNLNIDEYYPRLFSLIKNILPEFTY